MEERLYPPSPGDSPLAEVEEEEMDVQRQKSARADTSRDEMSQLQRWIQTFTEWDPQHQNRGLRELLQGLRRTQPAGLAQVREELDQITKRDFISELPEEVALIVLAKLDIGNLIVAGRVSRIWAMRCKIKSLWRPKCIREGTFMMGLEPFRETMNAALQKELSWRQLAMYKYGARRQWIGGLLPPPTVVLAHTDVITCLEMTSDHRVVTGSNDQTLIIWSLNPLKAEITLAGHSGGVWCCATNEDIVVSGATDHHLRVWSLATGSCLQTLMHHTSTVRCLQLVGDVAVSGSRDATICVWDVRAGICLAQLGGHSGSIRCLIFDGQRIISGSYDDTVKVWDATRVLQAPREPGNVPTSTDCIHTLRGHKNRIYSLAYDGEIVASGSSDGIIILWNTVTGQRLHTLSGHQLCTGHMQLHGDILVSGNLDKTVRVWNVRTGTLIHTLVGHGGYVSHVSVADGTVASCSEDGTVKLWDLHTGQFIRDLINIGAMSSTASRPLPIVWRACHDDLRLVCVFGEQEHDRIVTKLLSLDLLQGRR